MSNKPHRAIGSIANFRVVTTESPEVDVIPGSENDYSLVDLYNQLRQLRAMFNPTNMEYIEGLITKHMYDLNNPHETDLEKMGTSVIQELYNLWLSEGNEGTREEFLKILFQYVKIADVATTILGVAMDQVPSVKAVATVIERHNTNPDAHEAIFEKLFPGEEILVSPTFAMDALVGVPGFVQVVRDTPISYIDEHGVLKEADINVLPSDYTNTEPMFPIFGEKYNYFLHSEDFSNVYWNTNNGVFTRPEEKISLRNEEFMFLFSELATESPIEHTFSPSTPIAVTTDEMVTFTAYVSPQGRHCFGIRIPSIFIGQYPYVHFDLEQEAIFINTAANTTKMRGSLQRLPNDIFKVSMTVKVISSGDLTPEFYPIDIYDGDANYQGQDDTGIYVFAVQCTKGNGVAPYIKSEDTIGRLGATTIKVPLDSWYNPQNGTFFFETTNINPITPTESKDVYSVSSGATGMALAGRFPLSHAGRFYFTGYNASNIAILNRWSVVHDKDTTVVVHGYSPEKHIFGYFGGPYVEVPVSVPVNQNVTELCIGSNRFGANQFDGWIKRVYYYPNILTPGNINFFLGE